MKHLQPNEKNLADKLQRVPVPDVEPSWEQMRKLLDREMPETAVAWSGNKKWWWMGITAAFIMLAMWLTQPFTQDSKLNADKKATSENVAGNTSAANASNNKNVNADAQTTDRQNNNQANKQADNIPVDPNTATSNNDNEAVDKKASGQDGKARRQFSPGNKGTTDAYKDRAELPQSDNRKNNLAPETFDKNKNTNSSITKSTSNATGLARQQSTPDRSSLKQGRETVEELAPNTRKQPADITNKSKSIKDQTDPGKDIYVPASTESVVEIKTAQVNTNLLHAEEITSPAAVFNSLENTQSSLVIVAGKTDKAFTREMRKKGLKDDNRKLSKASMRGNFGDNERDITFAAGVALPQSIAISGQQASAYNINAKSNRIMDYLPAPFFQYHINNKLFLQTEFHFQSPQYTERLLFSKTTGSLLNTQYENNVYLEKLYYFNIPLNVYYSPARNFFIGSGVQYSSLLGGVASFEEKRMQGQTVLNYQSTTRRFKDDSVASVLAPNEWRYQFDANYYFKRFTFGLRYNQAMRDFISLPASTNLPVIEQRNRSFLLYLRFNIWEERKKLAD